MCSYALRKVYEVSRGMVSFCAVSSGPPALKKSNNTNLFLIAVKSIFRRMVLSNGQVSKATGPETAHFITFSAHYFTSGRVDHNAGPRNGNPFGNVPDNDCVEKLIV